MHEKYVKLSVLFSFLFTDTQMFHLEKIKNARIKILFLVKMKIIKKVDTSESTGKQFSYEVVAV